MQCCAKVSLVKVLYSFIYNCRPQGWTAAEPTDVSELFEFDFESLRLWEGEMLPPFRLIERSDSDFFSFPLLFLLTFSEALLLLASKRSLLDVLPMAPQAVLLQKNCWLVCIDHCVFLAASSVHPPNDPNLPSPSFPHLCGK